MDVTTEVRCPDCYLYVEADIYTVDGETVIDGWSSAMREHVATSALPHPTFTLI